MAKGVRITAGETFSYSGVISLPVGAWTCQCIAQNTKTGAFLNIGSTLTLVGPTSGNNLRNDWLVNIQAPASTTGTWSQSGQIHEIRAHLKFSDASTPPVVVKTMQFPIIIFSWPSP